MARGDLTDDEWAVIEPLLPLGERGPIPDLRRLVNGVMWRFRTGSPWRDMPQQYGSWSTVYGRFHLWAGAGVFQALMEAVIAEAAARGQAELGLVSVDSTSARAHHHAAGMMLDPELLETLEKGRRRGKGASPKGQNASIVDRDEAPDEAREERRRLRRRRKARLRAAKLGRSRGGLTSKVHLSADRRCRPLSFVLTPGQAADSPRFTAVLERIKVRGPVGRPRTRPRAVHRCAKSSTDISVCPCPAPLLTPISPAR
jgi:transposase